MMLVLGWAHFAASVQIEGVFEKTPIVCPLRFITGLKCAFCGMTHAWIAIARGDFLLAMRENLLSIPVFIMGVLTLGMFSFNYRFEQNSGEKRRITLFISSVLIVYAILRNIYSF